MARKLPGRAIQAGTITVTQLETTVATTVQTGGGPKITNIQITDNAYTVLDDTAVAVAGGYIKITGTGFVTGCSVIIGTVVATSVSFISSTEVRAQVPAQSAGTYTVYLVNPDGGVGIRVNGLNYSSTPTWTTTSPLGDGSIDSAISVQFVATSNSTVTYALQAGSTLPAGLSLSSSGLLTGTVTGITVDTTYNFTVVATDAENQDTPQAFSITITVNDPNFKNTVLLLQADTAPTVISDASTNNFDLSVAGDARASNFTPYGTGWSVFFDGNADYFTVPANAAFAYGTGAFTIEAWVYRTGLGPAIYYGSVILAQAASSNNYVLLSMSGDSNNQITFYLANSLVLTSTNLNFNQWYHIAVVRENTSTNGVKLYVNGSFNVSGTSAANLTDTTLPVSIGDYSHSNILGMNGYISNLRVVKGTAVYTATFTPPTQPLTVIANTSLLTCNANRFLDSSTNNFTITRNGDAAVRSFNPFNITNTGVNGSAYFDGTGDYITVPDNANLEPLGGNFTIETWFYLNAVTTGTQICGKSWWTPFYIEGSNLVTYLSSNGSTWDIASNQVIITSVATFRWYHVAMVRNGTSIKVYVNGTETLSLTSSAALHDGSDTFTIGARGTTYLNGYVADLRFVKGTAVYTANFTPPTQPLTAIANTQLLTLQYDQPHNNHTFLDSSSNQFAITRNGNTTQGTFSPFSPSGHSVYFDGTDDYLSIADNAALDFDTGNFTVEFWMNPASTQPDAYPDMITKGTGATADSWKIGYDKNNNGIYWAFGNPTQYIGSAYNQVFPNRWTHIAYVRSGTVLTFFLNGVLSNTISCSNNFNNASSLVIGRLDTTTFNDYAGYISNLRIIKGTALYTTNFTPSTTPLTNVANTSLLACHANRFVDGSANNFTVTRNGDARVTAFGPFSTTAYSATSNGGSAYFDGTGDYLTVPHDPAVVLNNEDWTIEFWVYPTVDARADVICKGNGGSYVPYMIILLPSGQINFNASNSGSGHAILLYSNTGDYRLFQWNHIAVTKSGSTIRIFCQGALVATGTYSGGAMTNSLPLGIGAGSDGVQRLTGYMSNVRIIKGTALYTSAFTVPTAPPSPTTNTSLLLNFTDAAVRDARGLAVLETVGDAKVGTVQVKYGTGSMRFDGNGDYLTIPAPPGSPLDLKSGDFTIEAWINYSTANTTICSIYRIGDSAVLQYYFGINSTNKLNAIVYASGASSNDISSSGNISTNTWTHVAVTRAANTLRLFINGVLDGTTTVTVGDLMTLTGSTKFSVGAYSTLGPPATVTGFFNGYIDDLRITRGIARYTANFTPPTAKFLAR